MTWTPRARAVLALLVIAYLVPGMFGHEPWKPDEPYTFGIVRAMLASRDWLVPRVGDMPFVEKPPLFYWGAAAFTWMLPALPAHEAARLASALFMLLTLAATTLAARLCWEKDAGPAAALLVLATLGLEGHAQRLHVDQALLAGYAIATLGFAGIARGRRWGGGALGASAGIGFLAKGLLAPATLALAALLLPLAFTPWRRAAYARHLVVAAAVAAPLVIAWPVLLWLRDASLFDEWLWNNNIGRFAGYATARLGATKEPGFWLETLPWFLFPLWLYLARSVARHATAIAEAPGLQIGLTMACAFALVLLTSASGRAVYALPLLPPLALAAAGAANVGDGWLGRAFTKISPWLGGVVAICAWGVWLSLVVDGAVPSWTGLARHLPTPFAMAFHPWMVGAAVALTAAFALLVAIARSLPAPALMSWVGLLSLAWGLAMTLWLPWIDAAKGYRSTFVEASRHVPEDATCVAVRSLGESERAMVDYYFGLPSRAAGPAEACRVLFWLQKPATERMRPGETWMPVWSGGRPGEATERFVLFVPRAGSQLAQQVSRGSSGSRAARR